MLWEPLGMRPPRGEVPPLRALRKELACRFSGKTWAPTAARSSSRRRSKWAWLRRSSGTMSGQELAARGQRRSRWRRKAPMRRRCEGNGFVRGRLRRTRSHTAPGSAW